MGSMVKRVGELARVKKPHVPDKVATVEVDWIKALS
jgi:hypothetical protein